MGNMNTPAHDPHALQLWETPLRLGVITQQKLTLDKYSESVFTSHNMKFWL